MKNPLNKRLPREFRKDFGKYLVIFLLLVITIGFVSGFLVADGRSKLIMKELTNIIQRTDISVLLKK